ncbi:MAG: NADPH-dependent assimilatory sulfite reductase hemoprotein subunit [Casimicrobiaceae bacterium]
MNDEERPPLSPVEIIKAGSRQLRGSIAEGLENMSTGALADDDTQLAKFHGIYQQDDRDVRAERRRKKLERAFSFMVRVRIPGGALTPKQWLMLDRIAGRHANGTIRLTTRQSIQFHGTIKSNLREAIRDINACLLDTIAACGDVNRNVMSSANPRQSGAHAAAFALAQDLGRRLLPRSTAYYEIWLEDRKIHEGAHPVVEEPIYGSTYLPRKFKIAVAVPPDNDVDVYAHDLGFIAIVENGEVVGWNVTVGGGMGMTHGEPRTFPRTADALGFCRRNQAVEVAEAVVTAQRDYGDRSDRKHARLKYTIEDRGIEWFRAEVERRLGYRLDYAREIRFDRSGDRYGWTQDIGGLWQNTLFIESGRVRDIGARTARSALHALAEQQLGEFRITPNQNLMICGVDTARRAEVEHLLRQHGLASELSGLRLSSIACVALPTCGLALAESERYLPSLIDDLEKTIEQAGLRYDEIVIRMSGCPNGCSRPYLAEIGLVGRNPGIYNLYLGAAFNGTRLNALYRRDVGHDEILESLAPLILRYARERETDEHFGDFVVRKGYVKSMVTGRLFQQTEVDATAPT